MKKETKTDSIGAKPRRKWNDMIVVLYITTFILLIIGQIVGSIIYAIPVKNQSDAYRTSLMYVVFIGIWVVMLLYMRFTKKNRPLLQVIGTKSSGNNWKLLAAGFFIGFALNGICILVAWFHNDIMLVFDSFQPISLVVLFFCVFVQSSAEELICRGFLYQRLRNSYQHPAVAIVGNSAFFALLHLMNPGVTVMPVINIVLFGILFSLVVYYSGSIWCAMAAHATWNFTQN